jgi:O-antigen/teichoic acid export membrane protein
MPLATMIDALRRKLLYLRLAPFDTTTTAGRDAERYRIAALTLLASIFARAASLVLMVASIHLTTHYLGDERFGVWAVFSSLVAMLSFADLGIGNALVNRIAAMRLSPDRDALTRAVSGGMSLLVIVGAAVAMLLWPLAGWLDWGSLLKLSSPLVAQEARSAAIVFALIFGVNLVANGFQKALIGQQRGFEAHLIALLAAVLACAALWLAAQQRADVPTLLGATFGVQTAVSLLAAFRLRRRGQLRMAGLIDAVRCERLPLMSVGALFFALQIGTMVGWGADALILGTVAGASQVAAFAITQRLFFLVTQPLAMLNAPLWAAYADAAAHSDGAFLKRTFTRSLIVSSLSAGALSLLLWLTAPALLPWLTRDTVTIAPTLIALAAVWAVLESIGNALGIYLNGVGIVRQQLAVVIPFCLIGVPLKICAALHFGAPGLLAATITAYVVTVLAPYMTIFRKAIFAPMRAAAADPPRSV